MPEMSTAALRDIIFMLLFFFMVVTVLRNVTSNINISLPMTSYNNPLEQETTDYFIFVGSIEDSSQPVVQINGAIIKHTEIESAIMKIGNKLSTSEKEKIHIHLKSDKKVKIRTITLLKKSMRKAQMYKLNYDLTQP